MAPSLVAFLIIAILFGLSINVDSRLLFFGKQSLSSIRLGAASTAEDGRLLKLRGGAGMKVDKKGKVIIQKKNFIAKVREGLAQVKPATRAYLFATMFCTLVHLSGLPAPVLFSLDQSKLYEIWRPITAVSYLGAPSMSMANSLYFLLRYGQTLETSNGTGAHAWFLLVQTCLLAALGLLLGFPFQAQAMIAAIVYVSSRVSPMERMPIQFGIVITAWQLPFCLMIIDCLSQQTASAAWPHLLGIFSGHVYHFFTEVWPSLGGRAYLSPPKWVLDRLGGSPSSNIPGVDFRKGKGAAAAAAGDTYGDIRGSSLNRSRRSMSSALLEKRRKGRKL